MFPFMSLLSQYVFLLQYPDIHEGWFGVYNALIQLCFVFSFLRIMIINMTNRSYSEIVGPEVFYPIFPIVTGYLIDPTIGGYIAVFFILFTCAHMLYILSRICVQTVTTLNLNYFFNDEKFRTRSWAVNTDTNSNFINY